MAKKEHIALVCINLHFIIILEYRLKTDIASIASLNGSQSAQDAAGLSMWVVANV